MSFDRERFVDDCVAAAAEHDPQAAVREVREEFGLEVELLAPRDLVRFEGGPRQIEPPYTILDCWVAPDHCHVDHVYLFRLVGGYPGVSEDPESPIHWLGVEDIERGYATLDGREVPYAPVVVEMEEGVRLLSTVLDCSPDELEIGMPVEIVFQDVTEEVTLPRFRRAD